MSNMGIDTIYTCKLHVNEHASFFESWIYGYHLGEERVRKIRVWDFFSIGHSLDFFKMGGEGERGRVIRDNSICLDDLD